MAWRRRFVGIIAFLICFVAAAALAAETRIGVVLLHGKGGFPDQPALTGLIGSLSRSGFLVAVPEMPYSKGRKYDRSYEDTMKEIDAAVDGLRKRGAEKIFVAGHSLGANAALHYGTVSTVDGILAIGPGHAPEAANFRSVTDGSVERAKKMVQAGKGDEHASFADTNQGRETEIHATARIYLSWFDPDGPAVMPKNAAALKPGTALLWVVGTQDSIYKRGSSYAFDRAPANPRNKYVVVGSDHMNTPAVATDDIIKWLKAFQN